MWAWCPAELMNLHKKQLIWWTTTSGSQAVDGIDQAEVLEIIDHHRIGSLETEGPVVLPKRAVGCTCTHHLPALPGDGGGDRGHTPRADAVRHPVGYPQFRSPTCTPADEKAARALAQQLGLDLERYADAMFEAGGDVSGKTAEEVFNADYKIFNSKNIRFGIGQGSYMSEKNRRASQALIAPYLETALKNQDLDFIFYMFTDVVPLHHRADDGGAGRRRSGGKSLPGQGKEWEWPSFPVWSAGKSRWCPPSSRHQAGGPGGDELTTFVPPLKNRTPRPFLNGRGVLSLSKKPSCKEFRRPQTTE